MGRVGDERQVGQLYDLPNDLKGPRLIGNRAFRSIRACLDVLEAAVALETDPDLAPWAWYAGTYQQYHNILFPLGQICLNADLPDAGRIMAMISYVFGPSSAEYSDRSASIIRAIRDSISSFYATAAHSAVTNPYLLRNAAAETGFWIDPRAELVTAPAGIDATDSDVWWPWPPSHREVNY